MRLVRLAIGLALLLAATSSLTRVARAAGGEAPVDVRGTWTGVAVTNIGTFPNTMVFKTEDFATGAVSGDANNHTYTLDGTITGHQAHLVSALKSGGYSSTSEATISADIMTMDGTFHDTNGRSGTMHFTRQGPPPATPSPSPSAAPTPAPTAPPVPTPAPTATATPACTFGGIGGLPVAPPPSATDPSVVRVLGDDAHPILEPVAVAMDTGDPRGRVFVVSTQPGVPLTVIGGRPLDASRIDVQATVGAASLSGGVAVDAGTGRVYVTDVANCQLVAIDGRADTPNVVSRVDLPGNPGSVAVDQQSGRIAVAIPADQRIIVLDRSFAVVATIVSPHPITGLAADATTHQVYVTSDQATSEIDSFDPQAASPTLAKVADATDLLAVDGSRNLLFTVDPASGTVASWRLGTAGSPAARTGSQVALGFGQLAASGPVSSAYGGVIVPASGELLVVAGFAPQYAQVAVGADGQLSIDRLVAGLAGGTSAVADPATGRIFVALTGAGRVAVFDAGARSAPSLAFELPGPLQVSLAPQDVARSLGITTLIMLLLGAPTPIFNSTLSANRKLIERWGRRRLPRGMRRRVSSGGGGTTGARLAAMSHTRKGLLVYLGLTGLLYSLLDPRFPFENGARTLGTTLAALAIGTALSQIPGELYVRRRHGGRGTIQVALWTLGLAAGCVVLTRVTGFQPGYVYGIIGGFTFKAALTADDRGRMAWRGMGALLLVGFAAWFLRIPFQPGTGLVGGDAGAITNQLLAGVFISAVESSAIGLIPLRFLSGATLFSWNRLRWGVLWALGLVLFAHVILYPVSSLEPSPSSTGLWTVLLSVAIYGSVAVGFWWFFRSRAARRERRAKRHGAAPRDGEDLSGDPGDPGAAGDGSGGGASAAAGGSRETGTGAASGGPAPGHG